MIGAIDDASDPPSDPVRVLKQTRRLATTLLYRATSTSFVLVRRPLSRPSVCYTFFGLSTWLVAFSPFLEIVHCTRLLAKRTTEERTQHPECDQRTPRHCRLLFEFIVLLQFRSAASAIDPAASTILGTYFEPLRSFVLSLMISVPRYFSFLEE